MASPGRVHFPGCDYVGDPPFVTRISGERYEAPERCRVVDARYLALDIPAETPPPFVVEEGARVVPVNDLVHLDEAPSQYVVVVGSGKTATDAGVWLLARTGWRPTARTGWRCSPATRHPGARSPRSHVPGGPSGSGRHGGSRGSRP